MFALFMGLSNFGYDVGRYSGAGLIAALSITKPNYERIGAFMVIKTACRLLPLLTVPFLVPRGTPADSAAAIGAGAGVVGAGERQFGSELTDLNGAFSADDADEHEGSGSPRAAPAGAAAAAEETQEQSRL